MKENHRNSILLLALVNLLLTPMYFYLLGISSPKPLMLLNYTLITLAGYQVCSSNRFNYGYFITAVVIAAAILGLYFYPENLGLLFLKSTSIGCLMFMIFRSLFKSLWSNKEANSQAIIGVISGYILLGIFGAQLFEIIHYAIPNSFSFNQEQITDFQFMYYSFTGVTTVGFGDIVPTNPQSQSISILMNITGQLYLAIVMALFVGKYINSKNS